MTSYKIFDNVMVLYETARGYKKKPIVAYDITEAPFTVMIRTAEYKENKRYYDLAMLLLYAGYLGGIK